MHLKYAIVSLLKIIKKSWLDILVIQKCEFLVMSSVFYQLLEEVQYFSHLVQLVCSHCIYINVGSFSNYI